MTTTPRAEHERLPHSSLINSKQLPAALDHESAKDVWTRSGSKYRIRAIVLLAVNVGLFAGVGSFAYWLRSGERVAPAMEGYWDELHQNFWSVPLGDQRVGGASLGSMLLEPISVQEVPIQPWIVGLLMAALISIPILVSLLYRFWSSLPFIAVVAFLAVMPWLALTLLISCMLTSVKPFRMKLRFTSALLGLIPVVVYLILAWRGTTEILVGEIDPVDRIKFIAPWVLAIVAAAGVFAVVLSIAKVVDYRPGAIAPLLAFLLALPVMLFEVYVGRDELYFRLLASLDRAHFSDVQSTQDLESAVMDAWIRHPPPRPSLEAVRATVETQWMFQLATEVDPNRTAITRHQAELTTRCDRFLKYFPSSQYAPHTLFIKGRALDMRVDTREFRRNKWIRFYDDFPSPASRSIWAMLLENQQSGPFRDVALLKLAYHEARDGDIERAMSKLELILTPADPKKISRTARSIESGISLTTSKPFHTRTPTLVDGAMIEIKARRLYDLIIQNRDPIYGYEPLCGPHRSNKTFRFGLLDLDPRSGEYVDHLKSLQQWYPNCQIKDNLALELAKAIEPMDERIMRLEACLKDFPNGDATAETMFRLATAYLLQQRSGESRSMFERLLREHGQSVWAKQTAPYLPVRSAALLSPEKRQPFVPQGDGS